MALLSSSTCSVSTPNLSISFRDICPEPLSATFGCKQELLVKNGINRTQKHYNNTIFRRIVYILTSFLYTTEHDHILKEPYLALKILDYNSSHIDLDEQIILMVIALHQNKSKLRNIYEGIHQMIII